MELSPLTLLVLLVFALLVAVSLTVWTAFGSMRAGDDGAAPERARNLFVREEAEVAPAATRAAKERQRDRKRGSSARTAAAEGGGTRGKGARIFETQAGETRARQTGRAAAAAASERTAAKAQATAEKSEPQPRPKRRGKDEDAFERFLRGQPDDTDFR